MNLKSFYRAFGFILLLIFICFLFMVFAGGFRFNFAKAKKTADFFESGSFVIFIGGAVENEGYYEIRYSATYKELFDAAGVLNYDSLKRFKEQEAVYPFEGFIICNFENFTNKNINYALAEGLIECGIPDEKADNIVNYIRDNGYFKDKTELLNKGLLSAAEYENVKYKIYAYIT